MMAVLPPRVVEWSTELHRLQYLTSNAAASESFSDTQRKHFKVDAQAASQYLAEAVEEAKRVGRSDAAIHEAVRAGKCEGHRKAKQQISDEYASQHYR